MELLAFSKSNLTVCNNILSDCKFFAATNLLGKLKVCASIFPALDIFKLIFNKYSALYFTLSNKY